MDTFHLAHLTDPHLTDLQGTRKRDLASKRILGWLSWRQGRRHYHRKDVLDALCADLASQAPDHIAVTGDLTHIGLPREFATAAGWLHSLGAPRNVTVVPGNHDAYVRGALDRGTPDWQPWFTGDPRAGDSGPEQPATGAQFPQVRDRGPIRLISLSSAVHSAPLLAIGRLGSSQLQRLATVLAQPDNSGKLLVLLVHHSPRPGHDPARKRLVDAEALCALLRQHPVHIILHGHDHCCRRYPLFGPLPEAGSLGLAGALELQGNPLVLSSASASAANDKVHRGAGYHLLQVTPDSGGLAVAVHYHRLQPSSGGMIRSSNVLSLRVDFPAAA